jgi:hypothetical protein
MIRGETAVVREVPVLCGDDQREYVLQPVCYWNNDIAIGHRKCATRQEVGLNIN